MQLYTVDALVVPISEQLKSVIIGTLRSKSMMISKPRLYAVQNLRRAFPDTNQPDQPDASLLGLQAAIKIVDTIMAENGIVL